MRLIQGQYQVGKVWSRSKFSTFYDPDPALCKKQIQNQPYEKILTRIQPSEKNGSGSSKSREKRIQGWIQPKISPYGILCYILRKNKFKLIKILLHFSTLKCQGQGSTISNSGSDEKKERIRPLGQKTDAACQKSPDPDP